MKETEQIEIVKTLQATIDLNREMLQEGFLSPDQEKARKVIIRQAAILLNICFYLKEKEFEMIASKIGKLYTPQSKIK